MPHGMMLTPLELHTLQAERAVKARQFGSGYYYRQYAAAAIAGATRYHTRCRDYAPSCAKFAPFNYGQFINESTLGVWIALNWSKATLWLRANSTITVTDEWFEDIAIVNNNAGATDGIVTLQWARLPETLDEAARNPFNVSQKKTGLLDVLGVGALFKGLLG